MNYKRIDSFGQIITQNEIYKNLHQLFQRTFGRKLDVGFGYVDQQKWIDGFAIFGCLYDRSSQIQYSDFGICT